MAENLQEKKFTEAGLTTNALITKVEELKQSLTDGEYDIVKKNENQFQFLEPNNARITFNDEINNARYNNVRLYDVIDECIKQKKQKKNVTNILNAIAIFLSNEAKETQRILDEKAKKAEEARQKKA